MQLQQLVSHIEGAQILGDSTTEIADLSINSRELSDGALFCCVRGDSVDGHSFASQAKENGAVALLVETLLAIDLPQVVVQNVRGALGSLASEFFGHPQADLTLVGVTGTNGKTTSVYMLDAIFRTAGFRSEIIGTLQGARTTPDVIELFRRLAKFRVDGITHVAMEVSSHALVQSRVDGIVFDVALFTNLTQDHLDYHGTMEEYFAAKASLFTPEHSSRGCVNSDDEYGRRLISNASIPIASYSLSDAANLEYRDDETAFKWRDAAVSLKLPAEYNVSNALGAATASSLLGIPVDVIAEGLASLSGVPGRLERVDKGQQFSVYVDYAHTPDGLEKVLRSLRRYLNGSSNKVVTIFGCGGDRDKSKRSVMGEIATELSEVVVVTSDNPRGEDPQVIVTEILEGIKDEDKVHVELDRRRAIALGIGSALPGDIVLIAGKGAESGQDIGGSVTPFDDREVAAEILRDSLAVSS